MPFPIALTLISPLFLREQLLVPILRRQARGCHGDWERSARHWTSDPLHQDPITGNVLGSFPVPSITTVGESNKALFIWVVGGKMPSTAV